jgi:cytochrome c
MRRCLLALLLCVTTPALAAGNAGQGKILAERWCVACHTASGDSVRSDAAPAFAAIARSRTPDQLRGWLAAPHPPMPNPSLTRSEIDDIVAYLQSLPPAR